MYKLCGKLKKLTPYTPVTDSYPVRLDANESFLSPPPELIDKMKAAAGSIAFNRYPDPYAKRLCNLFAEFYHVSPDSVTAGNGSDELISIIMNSFLEKGETVLTLSPDFSMYGFYTELAECAHITFKKSEDYSIDIDALLSVAKSENARMIIFSNPCNPTSSVTYINDIRRLLNETDSLVVLDEAYMDFSNQSMLEEAEKYDNLIILKTFSKAFGMAALRLGFAVAGDTITNALHAAKSPYNVNSVSQELGCVLLSESDYIFDCIGRITRSRNYLYAELKRLCAKCPGLSVTEPSTNFVFLRVPEPQKLYEYLQNNGVIVRLLGNRLRITAGNELENDAVLGSIENWFSEVIGNDA